MHIDLKHGRLVLDVWQAYKGPAFGKTKAVFGRNWFYFIPRGGSRDWKLDAGRMRCVSVRWLFFCFEVMFFQKPDRP